MDSRMRNIVAIAVLLVIALAAAVFAWPPSEKITQGLDLKGGLSVIVSASPLSEGGQLTEDTLQRVDLILNQRVNSFGVSEASVQRQGESSFLIQLPGVKNAQQALQILGEPGKLEFAELASITDTATLDLLARQLEAERSGETTAALPALDSAGYSNAVFMTGEVITDATVTADNLGNPAVSVKMDESGTKVWADVTTRLYPTNGQVVIILDGHAKSAPGVQEPITGGDTLISGTFTIDEAKALAAVLQSGAMPAQIAVDEARIVGPTLGQDSLKQGLLAGLLGLAFVALFMVAYYRGLGGVSLIALALYAVIYFGVLAALSALGIFSLTLPGIAGLILTIGVAADTSILIFERLKEEIEQGKTYRSAAKSAVRHAIATSIDADVVTLVSAIALYAFAIGAVRGFAFTLIVGIVIDLLVAVLFTGPVVRMLAEGPMPKAPGLWGMKGGEHRV